jgi:hypothetical protein
MNLTRRTARDGIAGRQARQRFGNKEGASPGAPFCVPCFSQETRSRAGYPKNPKVPLGKFTRFGKIEGRLLALTPNHVASVAAY